MQAARVEDGTLRIGEVPAPEPGAGEALVRISAAGVCHSDLHLARGDWAGVPGSSLLGHEGIGVVEALGAGAEEFVAVGDRVILGLGGAGGAYWCGACRHCLAGAPRLCEHTKALMGTFAEHVSVWAPALVKIPPGLSDQEAPLACGGLTAYGAVKKLVQHRMVPGRPIAVIGAAGGLGHYAVQLATAFGYEVVGIDVGAERLDFVKSLGAVRALDASEALAVIQSEYGGVDASLIFSAKMAGFQLGFDVLGKRGLMVCVGLPATSEGNIQINPFAFFAKDATIIYSAVGTVADMRELVHLAESGKVRSHISRTGSLTDLPAIFDDLEAARYLGRAVLTDLAH
ncbi:MAG TPA: zinc-binding dehydrogenase [Acidimicrobiia bacterium]|nr:zinc-binding dehydrogenase [Acidimicrobiia bacterium]